MFLGIDRQANGSMSERFLLMKSLRNQVNDIPVLCSVSPYDLSIPLMEVSLSDYYKIKLVAT